MRNINDVIKDNEKLNKQPVKAHLIRFHMYKEMESILKGLSPKGIGLTIADWRPIINTMMRDVTFYNLRYPEYDIQNLYNIPDNSVDVFYSEMVLEHIENPQAAIDESYRILKPGGIAIHTTVFMMPYHPSPLDLLRFSPEQLKRMHSQYSEIYTGGIGNWRMLVVLTLRLTRLKVKYPKGNILSALIKGKSSKYIITTYSIAKK